MMHGTYIKIDRIKIQFNRIVVIDRMFWNVRWWNMKEMVIE